MEDPEENERIRQEQLQEIELNAHWYNSSITGRTDGVGLDFMTNCASAAWREHLRRLQPEGDDPYTVCGMQLAFYNEATGRLDRRLCGEHVAVGWENEYRHITAKHVDVVYITKDSSRGLVNQLWQMVPAVGNPNYDPRVAANRTTWSLEPIFHCRTCTKTLTAVKIRGLQNLVNVPMDKISVVVKLQKF